MGAQAVALLFNIVFSVVVVSGSISAVGAATVEEQCADKFQRVTTCLTFATGKAAAPTKDCCTAVTDVRASNPVCLCYIIQQIHKGSNPQLKSMGIQEARLLQLPTACKLVNATSSDCPIGWQQRQQQQKDGDARAFLLGLLNLPPGSPDAAIFNDNSTTSATPTTAAPATGTSSSPVTTDDNKSNGIKQMPKLAVSIGICIAVFFYYAFDT